ncbi:MAG TPA: DUF4249 family protein [Bacteroidota bacterium]|nr:DUF4249 family protein [Bacteroidota bacterium]
MSERSSRKVIHIALAFLAAGIVLHGTGCDESFNPKAPFQKEMIVYSILSNTRDTQYVRVGTNYDVSGFDPGENHSDNAVQNAIVALSGANTAVIFKETFLPRGDTSRYQTPITAYMASPFRPKHGSTYALSVASQQLGSAAASVTMPDTAMLSFGLGTYWLDNPDIDDPKNIIYVTAALTSHTKGYWTQMFVDYLVLEGNEYKEHRIEVPNFVVLDTLGVWIASYPVLERLIISQTSAPYSVRAYVKVLLKVLRENPDKQVVFYRVVARVVQCEQNLYDYYNTVNGFRDPISIRLDEPDFSNVVGAKGLFGAMAVDSLIHYLPENFGLNTH